MWRPWIVWGMAAAIACALPSCARDDPTAPGVYALSGHVRMTGYLVAGDGQFAGTRVVGDADGVAVELLYGTKVVARTLTVDGVYRFTGVRPGGYVARTRLIGDVADATEDLTIVDGDLAVADTLRLKSLGDLAPTPNPILVPSPIVRSTPIFFSVPDTQWVEINVLDLAGRLVRPLLADEIGPGLTAVFWDGYDQSGRPANAAIYWVTFASGDDIRAHLMFR